MTKVHLDTCFLICALTPGSAEDKALRGWLGRRVPVAISAIAWAEFLCGPLTAPDLATARTLAGSPLPFGEPHADVAARLFNQGGRRRGSFVDCLIAAAAITDRATLATSNPEDFRGFVGSGLEIADQNV
jgi:predicted nucleic acid-binding protein